MVIKEDFKFIDLFAGIGGFHCAMKKYSPESKCVFACEINKEAAMTYKDNFGINPLGDITKITPKDIPNYDVVCGGFPCQPFSKAGNQAGLDDPRGTLFEEIIRLITSFETIEEQPKILILENVRNLITHDKGNTWKVIKEKLQEAHYNVINEPIVIGPKDLNIPQLRDRAIIVAVRNDIYDGDIVLDIERKKNNTTSIYSIVDENITKEEEDKLKITEYEKYVLDCWNDFIHGIKEKIIGFPIWSDEFRKNYKLPKKMPEWKKVFINNNRRLYKNNKEFIDSWLKKWDVRKKLVKTHRKFEWQVNNKISDVYEGIIQFRTSGVRVKQPTESPTLVALIHTPIIGKKQRYLSVKEASRLQSFPDTFKHNSSDSAAYRQLGNAVNVDVIKYVFEKFVNFLEEVDKK